MGIIFQRMTRRPTFRFTTELARIILPCLVTMLALGSLAIRAANASTMRYVDPAGTCSGHTPCYTSISKALSASQNNDVIALTANINEGDLVGTFPISGIIIESLNASSPNTITGGTNFTTTDNWTFQNIKFTANLFSQSAPNGFTANNVQAAVIVVGVNTGTVGGTITITNCVLMGSNSEIAVLGGDGQTITGAITISNNSNLGFVNVFAYTLASSQSDLAASVTLDHNTLIGGVNIGVNYRNNNTGHGNISGNVTLTNNTTTGYDSYLALTINAKTSQSGVYQNVTGNITGSVTIANNNSYKLAVLTSDAKSGDIDGPVNVHDNITDRVEIGSNGGNNGSITVKNNTITYNGSPDSTFISVYSYANAASGSIDIENNDTNLAPGATSTGIIVRTFTGDNNAPTTILNNVAFHAIYQVHGTNGASFTFSGNSITGHDPSGQTSGSDGYLTIVSDTGAIQNGTISYNHSTNLQITIPTTLNGTLTITGNTFDNDTDMLTQSSTVGAGVVNMAGNRVNNYLYIVGMNAQVHFNSIIGKFDTTPNPVVHAEENWWGCNAGATGSSPCHSYVNGGILEPHLVMQVATTCTAVNNAGVAFNLQTDNTGALQMSSIAPAVANISSSLGTLGAPSVALRNGAGSTTIGLPSGGGAPTATVKIDSQTLTAAATCSSASTHPDTIGIYRSGTFLLRKQNSTGYPDITAAFNYGTRPYPVTGDWTGAGIDTIGVFDQSNGVFYLRNSNDSGTPDEQLVLGIANDQPFAGRWMVGDTHDGAGVFRPSNGLIYLKNVLSTGYADAVMVLGIPGDQGIAGDWAASGLDSPGVYRPSNNTFYLSNQVCNCVVFADYQATFGSGGNAPIGISGDWIGAGRTGVGLFQSGTVSLKYYPYTNNIANIIFGYGASGDQPVAGYWSTSGGAPPPSNVLMPPTAGSTTGSGRSDTGLGD